ncbi:MAG: iron ABC transporter permease [Planctomycetota bacterium]
MIGREDRLWWIAAAGIASLVVVPIGALVVMALQPDDGVSGHILATQGPRYTANTLLLVALAVAVAASLGVIPAWLCTTCRFPGRVVIPAAMLLPLAVPPYLSAYAFADALSPEGTLRATLGNLPAIDVRTIWTAGFVLGVSLCPYVFTCARRAFIAQAPHTLAVARTLGVSPLAGFFRVALPAAWPAIAFGIALVAMEAVADFGVCDYLAVDTLTTGVYRAWYAQDSTPGAARLAVLLIALISAGGIVFCMFLTRDANARGSTLKVEPIALPKALACVCTVVCSLPIVLGFVLPSGLFVVLSLQSDWATGFERSVSIAGHTLMVAAIAAGIGACLASITEFVRLLRPPLAVRWATAVVPLGYAIPGPVIAIGMLTSLLWLDRRLNGVTASLTDDAWKPGLVLSGSLVAIVLGCQTRFLGVAIAPVRASFRQLSPRMLEASRSLGTRPITAFGKIYVPAAIGGMAAAFVLTAADVAKELPMMLVLRPFDFDTLAVRAYQLAKDERLTEAAIPGLGLMLLGLVPVSLLVLFERQPIATDASNDAEQ